MLSPSSIVGRSTNRGHTEEQNSQMENKEKDKKQLLLRLSPSLWKELMAWAENDFRSLNGQIEYLLTESVKQYKKKSNT